ncbi:MAG: AI-2E family transporter, partial [Candidatus Rokuibacteriota bacterium]
ALPGLGLGRPRGDTEPVASRGSRPFALLVRFAFVTALLYWASAVAVPVALALLITFLLSPVVGALERWVGRVAAVLAVVVFAFAVLAGLTYGVSLQLTALGKDLPRYTNNIKQRIADFRAAARGGLVERVTEAAKEVQEELDGPETRLPPGGVASPAPPVPGASSSLLWALPGLLAPLASAGLVVVLVIFMLLERQDIRNRLIRLAGYGRLHETTRALDEADQRISSYLLRQSIVNATFGAGIGVGLWLVGLPYALLWGILAAVLRFIPYAGPWVAALLPVALALAEFPGWTKPFLVVGLFLVLELFSNLVMETLLYAQSAGVSEVALLIAIAYWTWLWGPIGLVMATPLTVCLLVLAKFMPGMEPVATLLGDDPGLPPTVGYYQRLLAGDRDEAEDLVEAYIRTASADEVYDAVLLPSLAWAKRDQLHGRLTAEEAAVILAAMRETLADLPPAGGQPAEPAAGPLVRVVGYPAGDAAEELALGMLARVLDPARFVVEVLPHGTLVSEALERLAASRPGIVCVAVMGPTGIGQARFLSKRLRGRLPETKVLVGVWGDPPAADVVDQLRAAGAEEVASRLLDARTHLERLHPILQRDRSPGALSGAVSAA